MTTVIIMRFKVAPGRDREWEGFVSERGKETAKTTGYLRSYLLRPQSTDHEYRFVSWWKDIKDPQAFIRKETYTFSESAKHKGIVVGAVGHEVLQIVQEM